MTGKINEKAGFRADQIQKEVKKEAQDKFLPLVRSSDELLERYKDESPSLILHMYPTHFRFEQQDGVFLYNSPMKIILECIRMETIPPECVEIFRDIRTRFYEGCLIVQIRDHRQSADENSNQNGNKDTKVVNEHVIPSKSPPRSFSTINVTEKVYYTVLKPSSETIWAEMCLFSESTGGKFNDEMAIEFESQILIATTPVLYLQPATNPMVMTRIFSELCELIPPIMKKRKQSPTKKIDEAKKAEEEQLMLIMDEKQGKSFQPSFTRLAFIEKFRHKRSRAYRNFNLSQIYQKQNSQVSAPNVLNDDPSIQKLQQRNAVLSSVANPSTIKPMLKVRSANIYTKEQQNILRAQKTMLQIRTMQLKQSGMPIHQINEIIQQQAAQMGINIQEMFPPTKGIHTQL
ncbi:hypothetical protein T552_00379 [Pneumocystis carinii B80]|uniref:Spt20-like SEP domain-containing protein n=1 Tax=Pneumocystis carinii (strain B80) TaxID=1408658 RepID=A0A0W4ZQN5_PNEC8|nr:hypothetical protein T552_00379 [Pneumocystis carinii B80]KTW30664.1 hypothetical protein T552_00379 [Pneumocystis carinii B80]